MVDGTMVRSRSRTPVRQLVTEGGSGGESKSHPCEAAYHSRMSLNVGPEPEREAGPELQRESGEMPNWKVENALH